MSINAWTFFNQNNILEDASSLLSRSNGKCRVYFFELLLTDVIQRWFVHVVEEKVIFNFNVTHRKGEISLDFFKQCLLTIGQMSVGTHQQCGCLNVFLCYLMFKVKVISIRSEVIVSFSSRLKCIYFKCCSRHNLCFDYFL